MPSFNTEKSEIKATAASRFSMDEKAGVESLPATLKTFYSSPSPRATDHDFLTGLRGLVTIGTFLYTFLTVFLPGAVAGLGTPVPSSETPFYALVLRYTLGVLFWNGHLLYSFAVLLSARTLPLPFLLSAPVSKTTLASSIFRRPLRLGLAVAIPLAIATALWNSLGTDFIQDFLIKTNNSTAPVPYKIPNALAYMNSLLGLFSINKNYEDQAGNYAMPGGTTWVVSLVYQQSMTVYMTAVVGPFTHKWFRVTAGIGFIVTAWWVQSWAWYSITGLLLADAVTRMDYREAFDRGIPISVFPELLRLPFASRIVRTEEKRGAVIRIKSWIPCIGFIAAGLIMQYIWTDWRPDQADLELTGHTAEYYTGGLNTDFDPNAPQARDDNYFLMLGFMCLVEGSSRLRHLFTWAPLRYMGDRSLSYLLTQGFIIYAAGIKLYMSLITHTSQETATGVCFLVCALGSGLAAELFHRIIDQPSRVVPHHMFKWLIA